MVKILLYNALGIFVQSMETLLFIRFFMSILNINFGTFIGRIIYDLTDPFLNLARSFIAKIGLNTGMFDFSYILAMFFLRLMYMLATNILVRVVL